MKELEIGAELENMEMARSYVTEQLEEAGFGPKQIMEVELAVEEIFCNIANYAYKPEKGDVLIRCEVTETDKCRITPGAKGSGSDPWTGGEGNRRIGNFPQQSVDRQHELPVRGWEEHFGDHQGKGGGVKE